MAEVIIDSASIAPADRAEVIREVIWSNVVRVEITHQPVPELIRTVGAVGTAGPMTICSVRANATTVARTPALTHDDLEPSLFVGLQLSGTSMVLQDGREAVLQPGDLVLYDTTRPYTLINDGGIHQHFFRVPRDDLALPGRVRDQVTAVRFPRHDPMADLTAIYLRRLARDQRRALVQPGGGNVLDAAARPGMDLLRALVTTRLGDPRAAADPLHETLHLRIMEYVRAHLTDPTLSPARIAAHHHISVRHLYKVLSRHDVVLGEWIRAERLEGCRDELARCASRGQLIADFAYRWGFVNATHFSRLFRQTYGLSPRQWRDLHR